MVLFYCSHNLLTLRTSFSIRALAAIVFFATFPRRWHNQGRTASCPTAPSQIPACGITALGFSELLASHTVFFLLEAMTYMGFDEWKVFKQLFKPCPIITVLLTAPIEPFKQYPFDMMIIIHHTLVIASNTVVIPVPS